jgi:hypothetical protein
VLQLDPIEKAARKRDAELKAKFEAAAPKIFGAILGAVAAGLANVGTTEIAELPRLADFAHWVTACEASLGWEVGTFVEAFYRNLDDGQLDILNTDLVAVAMRTFVADHPWTIDDPKWKKDEWGGTASALHTYLRQSITDEEARDLRWPKNARVLSARLRRAAPGLRKIGIDVRVGKSNEATPIRIKTLTDAGPAGSTQADASSTQADASSTQADASSTQKNAAAGPQGDACCAGTTQNGGGTTQGCVGPLFCVVP